MLKNNRTIKFFIIALLILSFIGGVLLWPKFERRIETYLADKEQATPKPTPIMPNDITPTSTPTSTKNPDTSPPPAIIELPKELNYDVPFTSQAPFGNWDERHEEYCEEASILMASRFFEEKPITGPTDADEALIELDNWQMENFGFFESTTAKETAQMAEENFPFLKVEVKTFSLADTKKELASGNLVVLPALGRELGNPNFTPPGPIYHMLLVKGYLADGRIITNDPGTRKGADYIYSANVLANAVADYDHETKTPDRTKKVMLVISKK